MQRLWTSTFFTDYFFSFYAARISVPGNWMASSSQFKCRRICFDADDFFAFAATFEKIRNFLRTNFFWIKIEKLELLPKKHIFHF